MKWILTILIIVATFGYMYPINVDLIGSDGYITMPDSAFVCVICSEDTIIDWVEMDILGKSANYESNIPDSIMFANAIIAAYWEDSLADTTIFTIGAVNPNTIASQTAETLETLHGTGCWRSTIASPFILTMTEDRYLAMIGATANRPIEVYKGDSRRIQITVLDAESDTVDISGAEAIFTAREGESDTIVMIRDTLQISESEIGEMLLYLDSAQTNITPRRYAADIQITFPDGDRETIWKSSFIVKWDVTR